MFPSTPEAGLAPTLDTDRIYSTTADAGGANDSWREGGTVLMLTTSWFGAELTIDNE